jgi:hypothetical protein
MGSNRNHALVKVVHNDIDQTLHWMISLATSIWRHLFGAIAQGENPTNHHAGTYSYSASCKWWPPHQHPIKILWVQAGHLVAFLLQQLVTVYILYKQGITLGFMASCGAMTVVNLFHFWWCHKNHPLVASRRTLGPGKLLKSQWHCSDRVLKQWRTHLKTRIAKIRGIIVTLLRIVWVSSKGGQWK